MLSSSLYQSAGLQGLAKASLMGSPAAQPFIPAAK